MKNNHEVQDQKSTEVMFDGGCPLCRSEISIYQKLESKEKISWVDVSANTFQAPAGMTKQQLLKRFHIITPGGELLSGAAAFVFVWNLLPGWRWLSQFSRIPGMLRIMEWSYNYFLIARPGLQKLVRWYAAKT